MGSLPLKEQGMCLADYFKTPGQAGTGSPRQPDPPPNFGFSVARVLHDGADVFMHSVHEAADGSDVWVTMSLVRRDAAGLMTVKRQVSARFTPNGAHNAASTAAGSDSRLEDEASLNKAQVRAYIDLVIEGGGSEHRDAFIDRGRFVSHSADTLCRADGYDAFAARRRPRPGLSYHGVDDVVGEGVYVAVFSCFDMDGATYRACDLLRLEDGRIVEHWDVVEEVAPHSVAHNDDA